MAGKTLKGLFLVTKGDSEHVQYVRLMGFEKNKGLNIKLHSKVFKNSILNYTDKILTQ